MWRDDLIPASFRGVPFLVPDHSMSGGRRNAVHEFPERDGWKVEDLGRKGRKYKVNAYVLGPDYMRQRDDLIKALETKGKGILSDKYFGRFEVSAGEFSCSQSTARGGYCAFDLEFLEGDYTLYREYADTRQGVVDADLAFRDAAAVEFQTGMQRQAGAILTDSIRRATKTIEAIRGYQGYMQQIRKDPTSVLIALLPENINSSLLAQPKAFASATLEFVNTLRSTSVRPENHFTVEAPKRAGVDTVQTLFRSATTKQNIIACADAKPQTKQDAQTLRATIAAQRDSYAQSGSSVEAIEAMNALAAAAMAHVESDRDLPELVTVALKDEPVVVAFYEAHLNDWPLLVGSLNERNPNVAQTASTLHFVA